MFACMSVEQGASAVSSAKLLAEQSNANVMLQQLSDFKKDSRFPLKSQLLSFHGLPQNATVTG